MASFRFKGGAVDEEIEHDQEITPELLMVMSAAIAAYLGKTVRIRRARFVDPMLTNAWGQSSRVVLQASHNLRR
jgi:methylmalonyl-CoA carboxyltransferase large subunit